MGHKSHYTSHFKSLFRQQLGHQSYFKGKRGETLAAWFLRLKGYHIKARRFKTYLGEIDIIAAKKNIIAIVEIKARPNLQQAMEAITKRQQKRVMAAADLWLARQKKPSNLTLRFDMIAICPKRLPQHIKACWTASSFY